MTALHTLRTLRTATTLQSLQKMVLLLAAPFMGLAFAVLFPFVGLGLLAWIATEGFRKPARGGTPAEAAAVHEVPVLRFA